MASSTLDSYITTSTPPPSPLSTSQKIQDRNSTFIGYIYRASSPSHALNIHTYHKTILHHSHSHSHSHRAAAASHEIAAWRCMMLREGCNGLGGPDDFEVRCGVEDDGEERGGKSVLKVMEQEGIIDAIVIVSRWFGGTFLGPIRFTHIETCTRQVCQTFKEIEQVESIIDQLKQLDSQLQELRAELTLVSPQPSNQSQDQQSSNSNSKSSSDAQGESEGVTVARRKEPPDYNAMLLSAVPDIARAKRLVTARQNAIRSVKGILVRAKGGSGT